MASTELVGEPAVELTRRRVGLLTFYAAALVGAELLVGLANSTGQVAFVVSGLIIDAALVVVLPIEASYLVAKDPPLAIFGSVLVLPPLVRIIALATPSAFFTTVEWLAITGLPLLLAAATVMRAQGLAPSDVFLGPGERRYLPVNVTLAFLGVGLGFAEYQILRPEPWIPAAGTSQLPFAVLSVFLANGMAEELIFRGILLGTGVQLLGRSRGVLYVTLLFAVMHIGLKSLPELAFAFLVGLLFSAVVLLTRSLVGAIGAHTFANVVEYLVLPFGL